MRPQPSAQAPYAVRFEWGVQALQQVRQPGDVLVVVDVLSFTTCVDIACACGAAIVPCAYQDERARKVAERHGAVLAARRGAPGYTLSPVSLSGITAGTRVVLPSPNGSALSVRAGTGRVFAASLRNVTAVARHVAALGGPVVVAAAGERWADGSLRPAVEDLLCAGALIERLPGARSAEAVVAAAAWCGVQARLAEVVQGCESAVELSSRGYADDVALALAFDASRCVPQLVDGVYVDACAGPAR